VSSTEHSPSSSASSGCVSTSQLPHDSTSVVPDEVRQMSTFELNCEGMMLHASGRRERLQKPAPCGFEGPTENRKLQNELAMSLRSSSLCFSGNKKNDESGAGFSREWSWQFVTQGGGFDTPGTADWSTTVTVLTPGDSYNGPGDLNAIVLRLPIRATPRRKCEPASTTSCCAYSPTGPAAQEVGQRHRLLRRPDSQTEHVRLIAAKTEERTNN